MPAKRLAERRRNAGIETPQTLSLCTTSTLLWFRARVSLLPNEPPSSFVVLVLRMYVRGYIHT